MSGGLHGEHNNLPRYRHSDDALAIFAMPALWACMLLPGSIFFVVPFVVRIGETLSIWRYCATLIPPMFTVMSDIGPYRGFAASGLERWLAFDRSQCPNAGEPSRRAFRATRTDRRILVIRRSAYSVFPCPAIFVFGLSVGRAAPSKASRSRRAYISLTRGGRHQLFLASATGR